MSNRTPRSILAAAAVSLAAAAALAPAALARHGSDDPAGHDAGDDNGGLVVQVHRARGADDRFEHRHRHHRHGRHDGGRDDGANHR